MTFRTRLLIAATCLLLQSCATAPRSANDAPVAAEGPTLAWGQLRMQLPSGWAVETSDDGSSAIGKLPGTEDEVSVTEFGSRVADETPAEHLQRYIKELSVPEPPEVRNVLPFTPFAMPGGQPATTRIQDLGDDVFVIEYAIALPAGRMFTINFYRMGAPGPETERYSDLIRNARFDSSESDET